VPSRRVAVLPDTPQFDPWLTGRDVVALARRLVAPDLPADRDARVLADAGLTDAADRRVGGYSRGMLQRLGLAATVVGNPDLLLLDEPASALDPAGRREVLDLIARLRGRATVILSSHLLGDVQEVCDAVGVMRAGRLLFQGQLDDLLTGRAVPAYRVRLRGPVEPVVAALRGQDWVTAVDIVAGPGAADGPGVADRPGSGAAGAGAGGAGVGLLRVGVRSLAEAERRLAGALASAGAQVVSLTPEAPDLEDVFLELTS
jgi:ABC-2 type transport system ATP-binding protein